MSKFLQLLPTGQEPHLSRYIHFINSRPARKYQSKLGLIRHHILPKSMGSLPDYTSQPDNIIILTIREHFIAHMILYKCYGKKMAQAFYYMINLNKDSHQILSSRTYEMLRKKVLCLSKGIKLSEERIQKIKKGLSSSEIRQKISKTSKGRQPWNKGLPAWNKNRSHNETTKEKMRATKAIFIINTVTNEKFSSIIEAANRYQVSYGTIKNWLSGRSSTNIIGSQLKFL